LIDFVDKSVVLGEGASTQKLKFSKVLLKLLNLKFKILLNSP